MAATQTTTIETVSVVRPLKVISLICLCIAIALSIVSLCSTWWLRSGSFRTGLFLECTSTSEPSHAPPLREAPLPGKCHAPARDSGYIKAVAALMIIALIFTAVAFFLNICGLSKSDIRRKYIFYKFATYLAIFAVLLELTALIVFPACFYVKMKEYGSRRDWEQTRHFPMGKVRISRRHVTTNGSENSSNHAAPQVKIEIATAVIDLTCGAAWLALFSLPFVVTCRSGILTLPIGKWLVYCKVDWSYGLAWGATLFTFGASLLLICDKEHEEVYYKEKTIYNPPPELMN